MDELIESLNVRGIREHELREKLIHERERIVKSFKKLSVFASKLSFDDEDLAKVEKKEIKKVMQYFRGRKWLVITIYGPYFQIRS